MADIIRLKVPDDLAGDGEVVGLVTVEIDVDGCGASVHLDAGADSPLGAIEDPCLGECLLYPGSNGIGKFLDISVGHDDGTFRVCYGLFGKGGHKLRKLLLAANCAFYRNQDSVSVMLVIIFVGTERLEVEGTS